MQRVQAITRAKDPTSLPGMLGRHSGGEDILTQEFANSCPRGRTRAVIPENSVCVGFLVLFLVLQGHHLFLWAVSYLLQEVVSCSLMWALPFASAIHQWVSTGRRSLLPLFFFFLITHLPWRALYFLII